MTVKEHHSVQKLLRLAKSESNPRLARQIQAVALARQGYSCPEIIEMTGNISTQTYDHRSGDPYTQFSYDNLDRLMVAEYGIQDNNEAFTMDDLGNRTNVNGRDGNDVAYSVNNLTNRYNSVGDANLSYDPSGNLTKDKDGYEYHYDYESRIVKITKDTNDIAEFAYDALARRIEKKDLVDADNTRRYYYNDNWQVVCEYDGSDVYEQLFIYGNYIDEVLFRGYLAGPSYKYYLHDHLYSPVALVNIYGTVQERCEYDAYGEVAIMDASYNPRSESLYGNPYYFQGKRLDLLDSGNLKLMVWPYRNYSTYLGRWHQQEKLGIVPNDEPKINSFDPRNQYTDGGNLYLAFGANPVSNTDVWGLVCIGGACSTGRNCGIREYKENFWLDDNLLPHAGLLLGLHGDIDFGPSKLSPIWGGECPFKGGGVSWGKVETWDLEIKKTTDRIKYGHPDRPLCCCATCGDVAKCVSETCKEWDGKWYILGIQDCGSFVSAAKSNCCLGGGN